MSHRNKIIFIILGIVFFGFQFVYPDRSVPQNWEKNEIETSTEVKEILQKACYDCHSYETRWPIYSRVFPISFFMERHVKEGREEVNFSILGSLPKSKQLAKLDSIIEEVEEKEMPLRSYTWMHKEAILSEKEIFVLKSWQKEMEKKYDPDR